MKVHSDLPRCPWCHGDPLYERYHDEEWGEPVRDDQKMFEFLLLETFQAGLSWITILRKRENFRQAFDHFDYERIARYDDMKIKELLQNTGIIRNKLKIASAVTNAKAYLEVIDTHGSFCTYIWDFVGGKPLINSFESMKEVPATTQLAETISKDLKRKGFKFVGPTVVYAHMQATGMVNDHLLGCFKRK